MWRLACDRFECASLRILRIEPSNCNPFSAESQYRKLQIAASAAFLLFATSDFVEMLTGISADTFAREAGR